MLLLLLLLICICADPVLLITAALHLPPGRTRSAVTIRSLLFLMFRLASVKPLRTQAPVCWSVWADQASCVVAAVYVMAFFQKNNNCFKSPANLCRCFCQLNSIASD